jgi:carotenoid cleavage dioxygenase-like enzyme
MARKSAGLARRGFLKAIAGAAAAGSMGLRADKARAAAAAASAATPSVDRPWMNAAVEGLFRVEMDVRDCQVEGRVPTDLAGAFYRVGPDPQYPMLAGNIPFDGEGHVSMFRVRNGRVDFKCRFVRNERYRAQSLPG